MEGKAVDDHLAGGVRLFHAPLHPGNEPAAVKRHMGAVKETVVLDGYGTDHVDAVVQWVALNGQAPGCHQMVCFETGCGTAVKDIDVAADTVVGVGVMVRQGQPFEDDG